MYFKTKAFDRGFRSWFLYQKRGEIEIRSSADKNQVLGYFKEKKVCVDAEFGEIEFTWMYLRLKSSARNQTSNEKLKLSIVRSMAEGERIP